MSVYPRSRSESWPRAVQTGPREVRIQCYRLEVVAGPNRGLVAVSSGSEVSLGTAPGNQLLLTDPTVSQHHCVIAASPDGFLLSDLDSIRGTQLAGFRVQRAFVEHGAIIQLGDTQVRFDLTEERIVEPLSNEDQFGAVLGQSSAMRRIFAVLERVAPTDAAILLEGEAGTGKAFLADAIHRRSARSHRPFVAVDCGAIPPHLVEAALFGSDDRPGAFEAAAGGTLFLDEIADLSADLQPKLLRALEARQVRRLGSVTPIPIDVRVIASSNRDLRREVNASAFRADLFSRLDDVRVVVPPIRERPEDIELLVTHFYRQLSGRPTGEPPAELVARLVRQSFLGNVPELRAAVEHGVASAAARGGVGEGAKATVPESPPLDFTISFRDAKEKAVASWTSVYVRELLARFDGNLSRAARTVAMDRNHLRDLLRKYVGEPEPAGGGGDA